MDEPKNKISELPRMFSLSECRELLPKIYKITEKYYNKIESFRTSLMNSKNPLETRKLEGLINKTIHKWAETLIQNGVKVAGLWNVDFDSGDGIYYCWKFPENDILFFHSYESGLKGRRPISLLEGQRKN